MRVLLAAKYFHFPQGGGGLERNTHELCLHLVRKGVVPAVLCDLEPGRSFLVFKNSMMRKLQPSIRFPMDRRLGYAVFRGWHNEDGAREVVSRFKPDVVVVQSGDPVMLRSFGEMGIPRLAYFHEVEKMEYVPPIMAMGDVGLLANSEFTARKLTEAGGASSTVIRPLIDRALYVTQTSPKNALFINTSPKKGVEIAFQLAERRPDVQFDVVKFWDANSAHVQEHVRELTARAEASGNITLHEPTNDLRPLYGRARLLLAPSQWEEAWGRVATEAQINGIPVLASTRGGLPESVGPGGLLLPHDAPIEAWLEAFAQLWDDPAVHARYAAAALAYSKRSEIKPETIVDTFIATLEVSIARHRAAASVR